ncbi:phage tail protein [Leptothrix discophora]|uniref:Phage tail protein n=1 Tax=Leptothrix discophora TaxID=89 RepID=A0ABT9G1H6_LEPDI|nr:phage tail protein [Leptothrix discophora]MDP4300337.1 phage tail protein [Leptothrix discophora]
MPITALPAAPSRTDPANFSARADALFKALPAFVNQANALESSLTASVHVGTATVDSVTIGTGIKSLAASTGKSWAVGAWLYIASTATPANYMIGQVRGYNAVTGSLSVNVTATGGEGTFSSYSIGLTMPPALTATTQSESNYSDSLATTKFARNISRGFLGELMPQTSRNMSTSEAGYLCWCDTAGITLNLPSCATLMSGGTFTFLNTSSGKITIKSVDPDDLFWTCGIGSAASVALNPGDSAEIMGTGVSSYIVSGGSLLAQRSRTLATSIFPPGAIMHFGHAAAPSGWLKANGAAVSRTTYADLFASISTTFGAGDGSTTFTLPDLRGEFLRGWDDGRSVDAGRVRGSFQLYEIQSHAHNILTNDQEMGTGRVTVGGAPAATTAWTEATGGNETRPRNVALLACIKY